MKCWWSGGVGGEREREASAGPSGHPHTRGRSHPLARKGSMIARAVCGGRARSRGSSPPPHTHTHPNTTPHRLPPPFAHVSVSCAVFSDTILRPPPSPPPPPAASRLRRVQEDLLADYYRVHDHGFHWFLRQAYFHPDQQHHHGRKRGGGYGGCGGLSEFFCAAELNSTLQSTTRSGPAVVKLEPLIKQKNRKRPEPHSPHTPHRFLLCT